MSPTGRKHLSRIFLEAGRASTKEERVLHTPRRETSTCLPRGEAPPRIVESPRAHKGDYPFLRIGG